MDSDSMNAVARDYVALVLAVGEHNESYVDAYYGPEDWRTEVRQEGKTLEEIDAEANELLGQLAAMKTGGLGEVEQLRHQFLSRQLASLSAYVEILQGETMTFDEESRALYDAVAPVHTAQDFKGAIDELDGLLPGDAPLSERVNNFRGAFVIPEDRIDTVFVAALEECRKRTQKHLELPPGEEFVIEYVTDKPWSGYNWYQGNAKSLIQVNLDQDLYIDRAIDLACHEGYPGHHIYNAMLEHELVNERGWVEFTVYPLFSPMSLIAEGTANFGIEVAFPDDERVTFEREVLFPLAGIDPGEAERYYAVLDVLRRLSYAGNEAARRYLDGEIDREGAVEWLVTYSLMTPERASRSVDFYDTYRSYVINYNLGRDLVREYINSRGGTADNPDRRWAEFTALISSPRLPSGLLTPPGAP